MTRPLKVSLSELVSSWEASARFCEAVADSLSPGGKSKGDSKFNMLAQMISECVEYARVNLDDLNDPFDPVAWRDAEGVIRVGSDRRPGLLTDDEMASIKSLGLF